MVSKEYYREHREQCRAYHRKWLAKNPDWTEKHPNYKRDWTRKQMLDDEYKAKRREYEKNRLKLHPKKTKKKLTKERIRAKNLSQNIPVDKCEFCGQTTRLVRHHPDYNFPKFIVVCCYSCHKYIHLDLKSLEVIQ